MKKTMYAILSAMLAALLLMAGCGINRSGDTQDNVVRTGLQSPNLKYPASDQPLDLAVIVAARRDMVAVDYSSILTPFLTPLVQNGGNLWVITSDGNPAGSGATDSMYSRTAKGINGDDRKYIAKQTAEGINLILGNVFETRAAGDPDAAVLDAILLAANNLRNSSSQKYLVVIDNGLSTANAFHLTGLDQETDTEKLLEKLRAKVSVPQLSGVNLCWFGLGETNASVYPKGISQISLKYLNDIWTAILTESGAVPCGENSGFFVTKTVAKYGASPAAGLPAVKTVITDDSGVENDFVDPPMLDPEEPPKAEEDITCELIFKGKNSDSSRTKRRLRIRKPCASISEATHRP